MQISAARQLLSRRQLKNKSKYKIDLKTYDQSAIKILNIIKIPLFLDNSGPPVYIDFLITNNNPASPRILLGLDFIKVTGSKISYPVNQLPLVQITQPFHLDLETGYVNELELRTCTAQVDLPPGEEKAVLFELNKVNNVLPNDRIMIDDMTNRLHNPYYVFLSAADLKFDPIESLYYALGMVCNISDQPISVTVTATFEVLLDEVKTFSYKDTKSLIRRNFLFDTFPKTSYPSYNISLTSIPNDDIDDIEISRSLYNVSFNGTGVRETPESEITDDILNSFKDKSQTIILDSDFEADIPHEEIYDPGGLEISEVIKMEPREIVKLDSFDPQMRPFIKRIFLDKYSSLLATDTLDKGNLSRTLGKYTIQLNSSENLPRQKKIYYLGKMESQHLKDILEFHLKAQIIKKVDHRGDRIHHFSSPAYLVPRSKPGAPSRLIIDFKSLNSFIKYESVALPEISSILNNLRDCQYFSSTDLSNAYNSIELDEDCTYLTTFSTQHGSFQMKTLPQGLSVSPEIFNRYIQKALSEKNNF